MLTTMLPPNTTANNTYHHSNRMSAATTKVDIFIIINVILSIFIVFGNAFVAFLFFYKPTLLAKPSNKLLHSLSICDFLSDIGVIFHVWIQVTPIFKSETCSSCFRVRLSADVITTFLVEAATIHLCVITADRALSLFYALRYRDIVARSSINKVITVVWLVPFLSSALQITYLYPLFDQANMSEAEDERIYNIEMWYSIISFLVYMVIPFLTIGLAFFLMFREIRKLLLKTPSGQQRQICGVSSQQRRVIYIFSFMYLCFVILAMPYFTLRLYLDIMSWLGQRINVDMIVLNVFYTMKTGTSLCNPLFYSAINRELRSIAGLWAKKTKLGINQAIRNISFAPHRLSSNQLKIRSDTVFSDSGYIETPTICLSIHESHVSLDSGHKVSLI